MATDATLDYFIEKLLKIGIDPRKSGFDFPGSNRIDKALVGRGPHLSGIVKIESERRRRIRQTKIRQQVNNFLQRFGLRPKHKKS
ncbi:MAG: hypothetical protein NTW79_00020 [Candidatus Berkelbacteria bacterium]|nr:hypothetical protein [Candidatus Berkelbacteria bacterium]